MKRRKGVLLYGLASFLLAGFDVLAADMVAPPPPPPAPVAKVRPHAGGAFSGYIDASLFYASGDAAEYSADGTSWALRGAANYNLGNGMNIQIDGSYNDLSADSHSVDSLTGMAHLYYRRPDRFAAGAFVQASRYEPNSPDLIDTILEGTYLVDLAAGVEGAYYADDVTLYGRVGWDLARLAGVDADHFLAVAGGRYYINDNLRFDLDGQLDHVDALDGKLKLYSISVTGNYRLDDYPVTLFGGYAFHHGSVDYDGDDIGSGDAHSVLIGLRLHFGSDNLKDEDRNGPTWALASQIP